MYFLYAYATTIEQQIIISDVILKHMSLQVDGFVHTTFVPNHMAWLNLIVCHDWEQTSIISTSLYGQCAVATGHF